MSKFKRKNILLITVVFLFTACGGEDIKNNENTNGQIIEKEITNNNVNESKNSENDKKKLTPPFPMTQDKNNSDIIPPNPPFVFDN